MARGSARRLVLAVAPLVVAAAVPWSLLAGFRDRLPERALIGVWSRVAPEYWWQAPTWTHWASGYASCLVVAVLVGTAFVPYRDWPRAQRVSSVVGWAFAAYGAVNAVLDVRAATGGPSWWSAVVPPVAVALGGALGWLVAGPLPTAPGGAPPPEAERLALGPAERAVFVATSRAPGQLVLGIALLAAGLARAWLAGSPDALGCGAGLVLVLHSRARLRIGGSGVWLTVAGVLRRRVAYDEIRRAEVRRERARWSGVVGGRGFGYLGRGGDALVLGLSGGDE